MVKYNQYIIWVIFSPNQTFILWYMKTAFEDDTCRDWEVWVKRMFFVRCGKVKFVGDISKPLEELRNFY